MTAADEKLAEAIDAAEDVSKRMKGVHVTTPEGRELLKEYAEAQRVLGKALARWRRAYRPQATEIAA